MTGYALRSGGAIRHTLGEIHSQMATLPYKKLPDQAGMATFTVHKMGAVPHKNGRYFSSKSNGLFTEYKMASNLTINNIKTSQL